MEQASLPEACAQSLTPTTQPLQQTGNFYTIRSYTDHGCLELCNANVTDCSPPYMQASTLSQVSECVV